MQAEEHDLELVGAIHQQWRLPVSSARSSAASSSAEEGSGLVLEGLYVYESGVAHIAGSVARIPERVLEGGVGAVFTLNAAQAQRRANFEGVVDDFEQGN